MKILLQLKETTSDKTHQRSGLEHSEGKPNFLLKYPYQFFQIFCFQRDIMYIVLNAFLCMW